MTKKCHITTITNVLSNKASVMGTMRKKNLIESRELYH